MILNRVNRKRHKDGKYKNKITEYQTYEKQINQRKKYFLVLIDNCGMITSPSSLESVL